MARTALRVRLLTVLTGVVTVAVVAGGIAMAARDRGHDHAEHAHLDTTSGLLVTTRTTLKLCVEPAPDRAGAPPPAAVRAYLLAGLEQARRDPQWAGAYGKARYAQATAVDHGCPAPRLPQRFEPRTTVAGPGMTGDPSPYRAWIYVLDEASADRILGPGQATGVAAAELMREDTTLFPVSSALLIRQSRLTDTAAVAQDLLAALGLDPNPSKGTP